MKETIILVGGGGHCKACIDVIEQAGKFQIAGIIDLPEKLHQLVLGHPVIGCDEDLPDLLKTCPNVLITLGQIKSPVQRVALFNSLLQMGAQFPVICSPLGYISPHAQVADGTIVMHHALINAGARAETASSTPKPLWNTTPLSRITVIFQLGRLLMGGRL